jgi:hypothetical protein
MAVLTSRWVSQCVLLLLIHHHPFIIAVLISKKLTKSNYPMWHTQVLPIVHVAQLDDLLTSEEKEPDKEITIIID